MSAITPWDLVPSLGIDRATSYYLSTLTRCTYLPDIGIATNTAAVLGAVSAARYTVGIPYFPAIWTFRFAGPSLIIMPEGTTAWQQYIGHVLGSVLQSAPGYPGHINTFFALTAAAAWSAIADDVITINPSRIVCAGHSLGGAIAALLTPRIEGLYPGRVSPCWTSGCPRIGDLGYALGQTMGQSRLTNFGDPIPLLPPSSNTLLDLTLWPGWGPVVTSYRHWGNRAHLWQNGQVLYPPETNSWIEGTTYLLSLLGGATDWYGAHTPQEYARRVRIGINIEWATPDPSWPGLDQLDAINQVLNGGVKWSNDPVICGE